MTTNEIAEIAEAKIKEAMQSFNAALNAVKAINSQSNYLLRNLIQILQMAYPDIEDWGAFAKEMLSEKAPYFYVYSLVGEVDIRINEKPNQKNSFKDYLIQLQNKTEK